MEWLLGKTKRIWSSQACKERGKIPVGPEACPVSSLASAQGILFIKYKMYIFPKGYSLSYSPICFANQRYLAGNTHIPNPCMINEQRSKVGIPVSVTSPFPHVKSWKYISSPFNYWDEGRRAPRPLLTTKDAKLIALNSNLYPMLFKIYLSVYFVLKGSPGRTALGHRHRVLPFENSLMCPTQTSSTELKADENTAHQTCSYLWKTNWNYFLLNVSY